MKAVSRGMFNSLVSDLRACLARIDGKYRRNLTLPTSLDDNFFSKAAGIVGCERGDEYICIAQRGGRPHIVFDEELDPYESDCTLQIGGAWRIADDKVRAAALAFVSAFYRNNPFMNACQTVWGCLINDFLSNYVSENGDVTGTDDEDNYDYLTGNLAEMRDFITEDDAVESRLKELKLMPKTERQELLDLIRSVRTDNERDRRLLAVLEDGVPYAFEKRWDEDEFDGDIQAYANVCVNQYDYFPVTLSQYNPVGIGLNLISIIYDGDSYFVPPVASYLLEADGTVTDVYDREGFSAFCLKLNSILNEY